MAYKIHKRGAFVIIENTVNGELKELNSQFVQITKGKTSLDQYEVLYNGVSQLKAVLGDIQDANGVAYVEADWDIFRYEQCGSVNSSEVANPYPAPTTVEVDIPAGAAGVSGILGMGTNPIELLPAPGAGKYYEYSGYIEFNGGTTGYTVTDDIVIGSVSKYGGSCLSTNLIAGTEDIVMGFSNLGGGQQDGVNTGVVVSVEQPLNEAISLFTYNQTDPTLGDGTLRVIITYTVRTFGA